MTNLNSVCDSAKNDDPRRISLILVVAVPVVALRTNPPALQVPGGDLFTAAIPGAAHGVRPEGRAAGPRDPV